MKKKRGQVLLFTSLVILVLVCFVASIVNVGRVIVQRIKAQNAADAASLTAGVWQARGLNLLQILNGLHWDLNYGMALLIAPCIPLLNAWVPDPGIPPLAYQAIRGFDEIQARIASVIQFTQDSIVTAFPIVAVIHANGMARDNGADPLGQCLTESIGSLLGVSILADAGLGEILGGVPLYIWTVYPSPNSPLETTSLQVKKVDPGYAAQSPYEMCYNYTFSSVLEEGPLGIALFGQRIGWDDDFYYDEDGNLEPKTFIAGTARKQAYILGGLFNRNSPGDSAIIPSTLGIASIQTSGDDLDPAGEGGSWFVNTPFFFGGWPFPLTHGYTGDFDTQLVPVKLTADTNAEDLGIYH